MINISAIKQHWIALVTLGAIATCLVSFGDQLTAIAAGPSQIQKTQEAVEKLSVSLDKYIAAQEEANKQRDYLLKIVVEKIIDE